jgi:catechol 2,3-dioxygenase-like lactoylglutathione lyase family enzyme
VTAPNNFHLARVGAGVTDVGLGCAFYEALGFTAGEPFDLGTSLANQSETPGSALVIQIVRRDGFDLELVQHGGVRAPGTPPARRPMNQLGLAYLALIVDDVERVKMLIQRNGGTALDHTASGAAGVDGICCTDPFGLRILLLGEGATPFGELSAGTDGISIAHVGVCVADLAASARFYRSLGFSVGESITLGGAFGELAELDGVPLTVQPMREGAYPFLMLQWGAPRDPGVPVRLPLNRTGDLLHFGTHCDDFDAMLGVIGQNGGTIVERTRGQFPPRGLRMQWSGEPHGWVFILDPNGVQIEIVGPQDGRRA